MGIKKLFTFLEENDLFEKYSFLSDIIKNLKIDNNKFIIGVDANLYCYKYSHSYGNMLVGFYNQILKFYSNNIIPIYIFDGGVLKEKENTNKGKNEFIKSYNLTNFERFILDITGEMVWSKPIRKDYQSKLWFVSSSKNSKYKSIRRY